MSENIFEIEAPAPLSKFNALTVHPDNYEVMEHDDRARELTYGEIKELRAKKRELEPAFERAREYYNRGRERQGAIQAQIQQLRLIGSEDSRYERAQARINTLEELHNHIQNRINRVKGPLVAMQRINQRWREHQAALENRRLYKRLTLEMASEAEKFAGLIIRAWDRLGYCYRITRNGKVKKKSVTFERCIVTEDEIQLKIKTSSISIFGNSIDHLPDGVSVSDLISKETLNELTVMCERHVKSTYTYTGAAGAGDLRKYLINGAWLYIERLGLVDGLFNYVPLSVVMARYPNDRRAQFPLPLGVREGRKINWLYLLEHPHMMVNGLTGSGKSNVMHLTLTTLITMHSPQEWRFVLIDLKEGAELIQYEECPHTIGKVISTPQQTRDVLGRLEGLRQERMHHMRRAGVFNIHEYNAAHPQARMPHIMVVIDEYISIGSQGKDLEREINNYAIQLATKARAAGIHLFIGIQTPYTSSIPSQIKANITLALGGRQRTQGASMSAFGSTIGRSIDNIRGRMIVEEGADVYVVQMPHVTKTDIKNALEAAAKYPLPSDGFDLPEPPAPEDQHELVISTALAHFGGDLKAHNIWKALSDRGFAEKRTREIVNSIAESGQVTYEGQHYDIVRTRGNFFRLVSSAANGNGHLVPN